MPVTTANLTDVFTYHAPTSEQVVQYQAIREAAMAFASIVIDCTPDCADRQSALRHIRVAVMEANAAIALNGLV